MEGLNNLEDEKEKQRLEDDLAQIKAAIMAFSWMRGKKPTGITREEDVISEDFSDLKGQGMEAVLAERQDGKTKKELYAEAQNQLGFMFGTGDRAAQGQATAAVQGDAEEQFALGQKYYNGNRVAKNHRRAFECWRRAAEQGHEEAQFNVGHMYYHAQGVAKDNAKAAEWFIKAAEQGVERAKIRFAEMNRSPLHRWVGRLIVLIIILRVFGPFLLRLLGEIF